MEATYGSLPAFADMDKIKDDSCPYGSRYKVVLTDITFADIGIY